MEFPINPDYIRKTLADLVNIPSPVGMTGRAADYAAAALGAVGLAPRVTNRGAVCAAFGPAGPRTVFSAHLDTLGAAVLSVKPSGRIVPFGIGGYLWTTVDGEYVTLFARDGRVYRGTCLLSKPSVHVWEKAEIAKLERKAEAMEIRLDEDVSNAADVAKLGIGTGDFIAFDPRCEVTPAGYIKSRHLDDKAGVVAILAALDAMRRAGVAPRRAAGIQFNVSEENSGGFTGLPDDTAELIAVDMGVVGGDHAGSERKVSLCPLDSAGPYDRDLFLRLVRLAEERKIPYAVDIFTHYGSDCGQAIRAGRDVRTGLLGPGVHASHHMERTHVDGIAAAAALIAAYLA